jgi:hypothetical protein
VIIGTTAAIRRLQAILGFELVAIMGIMVKIRRLQAILSFELDATVRQRMDPATVSYAEL